MAIVIKPKNIKEIDYVNLKNNNIIKNPSITYYNYFKSNDQNLNFDRTVASKNPPTSLKEKELQTQIMNVDANIYSPFYSQSAQNMSIYDYFEIQEMQNISYQGNSKIITNKVFALMKTNIGEHKEIDNFVGKYAIQSYKFDNISPYNVIQSVVNLTDGTQTINYEYSDFNLDRLNITANNYKDYFIPITNDGNTNTKYKSFYTIRFEKDHYVMYFLIKILESVAIYDENDNIIRNVAENIETLYKLNHDYIYYTYNIKYNALKMNEVVEGILSFDDSKSRDYKLDSNDYVDYNIAQALLNNVYNKYNKGRETIRIIIYRDDYYNEDGNIVYSKEELIKVGDIVIPYKIKDGKDVPISNTKNSLNKYLVTSAELTYTGGTNILLELLEVK